MTFKADNLNALQNMNLILLGINWWQEIHNTKLNDKQQRNRMYLTMPLRLIQIGGYFTDNSVLYVYIQNNAKTNLWNNYK